MSILELMEKDKQLSIREITEIEKIIEKMKPMFEKYSKTVEIGWKARINGDSKRKDWIKRNINTKRFIILEMSNVLSKIGQSGEPPKLMQRLIGINSKGKIECVNIYGKYNNVQGTVYQKINYSIYEEKFTKYREIVLYPCSNTFTIEELLSIIPFEKLYNRLGNIILRDASIEKLEARKEQIEQLLQIIKIRK